MRRARLVAPLVGLAAGVASLAAPAASAHSSLTLRKDTPRSGAAVVAETRAGTAAAPEGVRGAAARRRAPDFWVRPGGRFGVHRRDGDRRVPVRGARTLREEILRGGDATALARGELVPQTGGNVVASVPGQDTLRVLVLLVDFLTDRSGSQTTGDGRFNRSPPDTVNQPIDPTPHNRAFYDAHMRALSRYWYRTTAGRLIIEWDVYPKADSAYHATDMADYGPWVLNPDAFNAAYRMFRSWVVAADTQDVSIPWDEFDRLTIFHAGSDLQSDVRLDSPNDVPTFTIGLDDSLSIPVADSSFYIYGAAILPETANQDGFFAALNAVNAHEQGHNLVGWRDVYDVFSGFPVCGEWTLMDTGNLVGTTVLAGEGESQQQFFAIGLLPPLADPYQRHLLYDDLPRTDEPQWGAIDSLGPPQLTQRALRVPLSAEEYLLVENRQDDLNGDGQIVLERDPPTRVILGPGAADSLEYDYLLPGRGVLAWRVDESVVNYELPGRRADDFFTINGNPNRRGMILFEGDGLQDLGDFSSPFALGSPLDPFFIPNGSRLAADTRPPLRTNSRTEPHVSMEVLDTLRLFMRVRVDREWRLAGWPVKVRPTPTGIEPLVFPGIGGGRVVYAAGDSAIHARNADGTPAGLLGSVLWQSETSVSPVARLDHSTLGAVIVAASPSPDAVRDTVPEGAGARVAALLPNGSMLPDFPVLVPPAPNDAPDWVTAGPIVADLDGSGPEEPSIVIGTRGGRIIAYSTQGNGVVLTATPWLTIAGGPLGDSPIVALAAVASGPHEGALAAATADGGVAMRIPLPLDAGTNGGAVGSAGWDPTLAFVEMERGAPGTQGSGAYGAMPQLVVLDRRTGDGAIYSVQDRIAELRGIDAALSKAVAAGDLDADGFNEVVLLTADGRIGVWNLSGSPTIGWPRDVDPEPFTTIASPVVAQLGGSETPEVVAAVGSGRIYALDATRAPLPGWPLGTGAGQTASPALLDVDGDGVLEMLIADADSLLHAFAPPVAPLAGAPWPVWGADPQRSFSLVTEPATGGPVAGNDLVLAGSLVCHPNPARSVPIVVSFRTRAPGRATLTLYDVSGRQVAELDQATLASDNSLVWPASGQSPGLYLGRLRVEGDGKTETHLLHIGVLK